MYTMDLGLCLLLLYIQAVSSIRHQYEIKNKAAFTLHCKSNVKLNSCLTFMLIVVLFDEITVLHPIVQRNHR